MEDDVDVDLCMGARLCLAASGVENRGAVGILLLSSSLPWLQFVKRCPAAVAAVFSDGVRSLIVISIYLPSRRFSLVEYQRAIHQVRDLVHRTRCACSTRHVHIILGGDVNIDCHDIDSKMQNSVSGESHVEDWASHEKEDRACLLADLLISCSLDVPVLPATTWRDTQGNASCLDLVAASSVWGAATVTVDEALPHIRQSDHDPLWLHLSRPKLSKKSHRHHVKTWQYAQQHNHWPLAKGWKTLDTKAYNSIIAQQIQSEQHATISSVSTAINQAASYTKAYPSPQEDPQVSSLYNRAAMCGGSQRKQLLSDAAAMRRVRRRQARQRQAETLSAGIWWQTQRVQHARHVPSMMSSEPSRTPHPRTSWSRMVFRYCKRLFHGPERESIMISACLTLARQRAVARRVARWQQIGNGDDNYSERFGFSQLDFHDVVHTLPRNKAVGTDGLSGETLLALDVPNQARVAAVMESRMNGDDDPEMIQMLQDATSQQLFCHASAVDPWKNALALMLPKTSKPTSLLEFRSTHLLPILQKLYLKYVATRLSHQIWPAIQTNQHGARPKHQALQVVHSIRLLQEKTWESKAGLVLVKIDIRKAFDRTRRSLIMKRLLSMADLDARLVYALIREWHSPHVQPSVAGQLSQDSVSMRVGLRQGGSDSSLGFVLAMDSALSPAVRKWDHLQFGHEIPGVPWLHHFLFVDDLILVAASIKQALEMYADVEKCLSKTGLEVQEQKTEYWASADIPLHSRSRMPGKDCSSTGKVILGCNCHFPHGEAAAVAHRVKAMWATFQRLRGLLRCRTVPIEQRLAVLKSTVLQSGLWGLAALPLRHRDISRLRAAHLAILNRIIPFRRRKQLEHTLEPWQERHVERCRHSYKIAAQCGHVIIDKAWAMSYWKWAGHISRTSALHPRALLLWRSFEWWREQQQLSCGWRHSGKRGNLWRYEALLSRWAERNRIASWMWHAQDRDRWHASLDSFIESLAVRTCEAVQLSGKRSR